MPNKSYRAMAKGFTNGGDPQKVAYHIMFDDIYPITLHIKKLILSSDPEFVGLESLKPLKTFNDKVLYGQYISLKFEELNHALYKLDKFIQSL